MEESSSSIYHSPFTIYLLDMSENLTRDAFAENLKTKFAVRDGDATFELELYEVSELNIGQTITQIQERFSLIFRGTRDRLLHDNIYQMEHEALGQFELFLAPVEEDANHYYYQASFNRLLPKPTD